jgi:hypothetical protein
MADAAELWRDRSPALPQFGGLRQSITRSCCASVDAIAFILTFLEFLAVRKTHGKNVLDCPEPTDAMFCGWRISTKSQRTFTTTPDSSCNMDTKAKTETLLCRCYAAFNARDSDGALALMRPDVTWDSNGSRPLKNSAR